MSLRTCQRKGCTTSEPPKFQVIFNLKDADSKSLGELAAKAVICEPCRSETKILHFFTIENWLALQFKLKLTVAPSMKKSELSFREINFPS